MVQNELICPSFFLKNQKQITKYPFDGLTDQDGINLDKVFPLSSGKCR